LLFPDAKRPRQGLILTLKGDHGVDFVNRRGKGAKAHLGSGWESQMMCGLRAGSLVCGLRAGSLVCGSSLGSRVEQEEVRGGEGGKKKREARGGLTSKREKQVIEWRIPFRSGKAKGRGGVRFGMLRGFMLEWIKGVVAGLVLKGSCTGIHEKFYLLLVIDVLWIWFLPGLRHRHVIISIYEEVKSASVLEEGQEGDRCRDLADDGLDFPHNILLALLVCLTSRIRGSVFNIEESASFQWSALTDRRSTAL
jgi:hypothetical protein